MAVKYTFSIPVALEPFVKIVRADDGAEIEYRRDSLVASKDNAGRVIIREKYTPGSIVAEGLYTEFSPSAADADTLIRNYNANYFLFDALSDGAATEATLLAVASNTQAETEGFKTTTVLTAATSLIYTSPVLDANGYTQVQTEVLADQDGTMTFTFCSDSGATDVVRTLTVPYTAANGYQLFAAPAFTNFIKYSFNNNSGVDQTDFYFTTKLLTAPLSPQTLRIDGFLSPAMMGNVTRSVIAGLKGDGTFDNVTITETSNDSGTFQNLNVVSGARPSQLSGRTPVEAVIDLTGDGNVYTPGAGKTFYITDVILTIDNSDISAYGRINIRDSLSAGAGTLKLPILVQESPNNETAVQVVTLSFTEPMPFSTAVFFDFIQGTLIATGVIMGYEE